jgi:Transglycosylase SLT domain
MRHFRLALALAGATVMGIACGQAAAQGITDAAGEYDNVGVSVSSEKTAAGQAAVQGITEAAGEAAEAGVADRNEMISFGERKVARWLVETVERAAKVAGLDPAYVMALADKESGFDPDVRAKTSSAVGLFQFLEATWLHVLSEHAAKHGYHEVAAAITVTGGRPSVAPEARDWVLDLRRDPYLSALMACEMAKDASERLAKVTNGELQDADLYLAHLLGTGGAARMLKLVETKPSQKAHAAFPQAAKANRSLFAAKGSKKKKKAMTVAELRARITGMMQSRLERYASLAASPERGR